MPPLGGEVNIEDKQDVSQPGFIGPKPQTSPPDLNTQDGPPTPARARSNASQNIPFLERLRALPEVRTVPWREGQSLPPEKALESPRVQQRGAILLSTRGNVSETPCSHCASGFGRFSQCITLEHWFQGACSTCIFTSKGNKCSLRFETSGTADGRALRYHSSNPEMLQSYLQSQESSSQDSKKRKRRSEVDGGNEFLITDNSTPQQQLESQPSVSPNFDTPAQVQPAASKSQTATISKPLAPLPKKKYTMRAPSNQASMTTTNANFADKQSIHTHGWTPANISNPPLEPVNYIRSVVPRHATTTTTAYETIPLVIESLTEGKQKEIYKLVGGLQGNIDGLQKQLGSLKEALGIDLEEKARLS